MLREFLYLQTIAVAMTISVFQHETQSESTQTLEVLPTAVATAESKSYSLLQTEQPALDLNDNITGGVSHEVSISEHPNQRTNWTAANTAQTTELSNTTGALTTRYIITTKKRAKNSFPFYAYILFALVPIFTVFILLR